MHVEPSVNTVTIDIGEKSNNIGIVYAFIGAICYGIYSGIIKKHIPTIESTSKKDMTADQRILIMTILSAVLFIIIFIIMIVLGKGNDIIKSFMVFTTDCQRALLFLLYAILNFTIAHWLWNMLNYGNSTTGLANTAYLIPLLSTIILTWWGKNPLGIPSAIGLCIIVASLIVSNYRSLNSVIFTFTSIFLFILLDSLLPTIVNDTSAILSYAQYLLETVIAMFAIYYGFVLNRVVTDNKEYEKTLVESQYAKATIPDHADIIIEKIKKKEEWITAFKDHTSTITDNDKNRLFETYSNISNMPRSALSIAEWVVFFLLSVSILFLCAIIRSDIIWIKLIVLSICVSICLCGSILIEQEKKLREIKDSLYKQTSGKK